MRKKETLTGLWVFDTMAIERKKFLDLFPKIGKDFSEYKALAILAHNPKFAAHPRRKEEYSRRFFRLYTAYPDECLEFMMFVRKLKAKEHYVRKFFGRAGEFITLEDGTKVLFDEATDSQCASAIKKLTGWKPQTGAVTKMRQRLIAMEKKYA